MPSKWQLGAKETVYQLQVKFVLMEGVRLRWAYIGPIGWNESDITAYGIKVPRSLIGDFVLKPSEKEV